MSVCLWDCDGVFILVYGVNTELGSMYGFLYNFACDEGTEYTSVW